MFATSGTATAILGLQQVVLCFTLDKDLESLNIATTIVSYLTLEFDFKMFVVK